MTFRAVLAAALATASLLSARPAGACSLCGCGDPLVDASDSVPVATRFRLALDLEWLSASAASDDDPAATESVTQQTIRPVFVYSPAESLNLVLQVPFTRKDWSLSGGTGDASAVNAGLGDVEVGARWYFWQHRSFSAMSRQAFGLSAGVTLPTGPNDASENGMRLDDHAQLGTGSFGGYVGVVYGYHRDPWNVFASVTAVAHGTNAYDYHYGGALRWTARLDYRLADRVAFEAGVDGRYAWNDTSGGDDQVNTGGLVVSAAPGLAVNVGGDVWLRARVQIPVVTSLNGDQSIGITAFASAQLLIR